MNMNMRFRELFTGDRRRSGNTNVNVILLVSITFAIGTSTSGSTTPTECSDPHQNPYGGFCYLARLKEKHTWNGAVDQCRQQDMELASVHSMSEGDFIHGLVTSRTKWEGVWIGMRRDGNGEFRWLDGTSTSIFNWADKEPNSNKTGSTYNEKCVEMYKSDGKWNDLPCVRILGYVCKALKRTTVRLVGGSSLSEGRVEIQRNGAFGTVCDDYWGHNDAAVICRMLGYIGGKALGKSHYGRGTGSIWLDNVACKGDEDDVFLCKHRGWGIEDCDHTEDAGVSCYARTTVRLVGGSRISEGRVEIQRNGAFGTVCDDYWDDNDAAVICRMMGYSGGKALVKSHYGRGTGSIWLDNVACKGDEDDVFICKHRGWGTEDCDHTEDAGVSCQASTRTTVRLVGGSSLSEGRVEIQRNGAFGTVCDDYWDDNDAAVICRMLGYSGGKALVESHYGRGTGSIWLDNVACKGDEDDVFLCKYSGWGVEDCDHTEDAGVSCQASTMPQSTTTGFDQTEDSTDTTIDFMGKSSTTASVQMPQSTTTRFDQTEESTDTTIDFMGKSSTTASVQMPQSTTTGFDQTEDSTDTTIDFMGKSSTTASVQMPQSTTTGFDQTEDSTDTTIDFMGKSSTTASVQMPQSTTTGFDQTEESTDTTIDFMGKSSTTASVQMPQNTTTRFNQTEESTDTTIDFMGKSSTTASVQIFDTGMTCSQLQMDETGSNVIWNCRLIGVFPKTICQVEYSKHQISNSALLPLNHYSTHTAFATKPDFVDSVCTLEMPAELLDAGTYTFIMSMQPDVFDGSRHVQSVQSDFILVKHNVEGRCTLDTLWIIGGTGAALLIFLFICSVIGFCLGKRHGKGEYSTKADNHTGTDKGINLEGLNMDTPSNSDEHPDQTTRYRPMAFNKTPTPRMSLKEKQQSKQQKPKKQQESGNDIADVYVNQSDPRSKSASQNHDYHHSKSNKCLNTAVFKQQQESNNVFPEKAMLPRNYTEKQQQKNAAFDPSEEDLEPAETRNILSGTGRPFDGVTAARWDEGPSGSDDENIYEEIFPNQAIDCDTCNDNFFLEPDQGKAIPVSNDTEIAMENMYMSI